MKFHTEHRRGKIHDETGTPCQDAYSIIEQDDLTILVIADGHGGAAYCRSDRGAEFACFAATEVLMNNENCSDIPYKIKKKYDMMVQEDLDSYPFSDEELELTKSIQPQTAYGTTCLAVVIKNGVTDAFQLGDGCIYFLNHKAEFMESFPEDKDCNGSFTSSMAYDTEQAAAHFRHLHFDLIPSVIIMCSDGYKSHFSKPYPLATAIGQIDTLNDTISKGEHGDDLTVIIAYDHSAVNSPEFGQGLENQRMALLKEEEQIQTKALINMLEQKKRSLTEYLNIAKEISDSLNESDDFKKIEKFNSIIKIRKSELDELERIINIRRYKTMTNEEKDIDIPIYKSHGSDCITEEEKQLCNPFESSNTNPMEPQTEGNVSGEYHIADSPADEDHTADSPANEDPGSIVKKEESGMTAETKNTLITQMEKIKSEISEVKNQLRNTAESFQSIAQASLKLSDDITCIQLESGLRKLCELQRNLVRSSDLITVHLGKQMESILTDNFGLEKIVPEPYDEYDSKFCTRLNNAVHGSKISKCRDCGWKLNDTVLVRAVVDTI